MTIKKEVGIIKNKALNRLMIVLLLGFISFGAFQGIMMDDSMNEVKAVQTGSETIQTESDEVEEETCNPMEVPEGVDVPVDGISLEPLSNLFGDLLGVSSLEKSTVISVLRKLQTTLLEHMSQKGVPDCILEQFESSLHSVVVLYQEELITKEQLKSEVKGILAALKRNVYYGVQIDVLVNMGVPRTLIEKYADKVLEEKDVEISAEELVNAARNVAQTNG